MADEKVIDPADNTPAEAGPPESREPEGVANQSIAALQRERDDYRDRWVRTTAEFDNYRKRIERERREQRDLAVTDLLGDLLLVVDDFDLALTSDAGHGASAYRKGMELIHAKLHDLLRRQGVTPMDVLGSDFDPNLHQAVTHEPSPGHRDGEVIGELRRGYLINGRLLRPAMVKVAQA